MFLDGLGMGDPGSNGLPERKGAFEVAGLVFEAGQVTDDLAIGEEVGFRGDGHLLVPALEGQFPQVAGASDVLTIICMEATEFEEDFVAVRVGAETFAKELFGLIDIAELAAQPIGTHGEALDLLWIEVGGDAEPWEDFTGFGCGFEVDMTGGTEIAAEAVDPVAGRGF